MSGTDIPSRASMSSRANTPTIISHQQSRHPGMVLARPVEQGSKQQEAERIRGGCLLCPGGNIWLLSCGAEVYQPNQSAEVKQVNQMTLPTREHVVAPSPEAPQQPRSARQIGREKAHSLPQQTGTQCQRQGPRVPVQSAPTRPPGAR